LVTHTFYTLNLQECPGNNAGTFIMQNLIPVYADYPSTICMNETSLRLNEQFYLLV